MSVISWLRGKRSGGTAGEGRGRKRIGRIVATTTAASLALGGGLFISQVAAADKSNAAVATLFPTWYATTDYVYAKQGETAYVAVKKDSNAVSWASWATPSMDVKITDPTGAVRATCTFTTSTANGTVCGGAYPVSSAALEGEWTANITPGGGVRTSRILVVPILEARNSLGAAIEGRHWTNVYGIGQAGTDDITVWVQTEAGPQYKVFFKGYRGGYSALWSDNNGLLQGTTGCVPLYKSIWMDNNDESQQIPRTCGTRHKIFFEQPAADLPASVTLYNGTTDWILPTTRNPIVSGLAFTSANNASVPWQGTLSWHIEGVTGSYLVTVDTNGDGVADRTWTMTSSSMDGQDVTLAFDGKDGSGNVLPKAASLKATVDAQKIGEAHFVMLDLEDLYGGMSITGSGGTPNPLLYWDDTDVYAKVGPNGAPSPIVSTGLDSSSTLRHAWSNVWGDQTQIDTWVYIPASDESKMELTLAEPVLTIDKKYDNVTSPGKTPVPGDTVKYTITAKNTGAGDFSGPELANVVDNLSKVIDDAAYQNDAKAYTSGTSTLRPEQPTFTSPRISWSGGIKSGESVDIVYTVKIGTASAGDNAMTNVAFQKPTTGNEPTCNPRTNDGKDQSTGLPCGTTTILLPALTLAKVADATSVSADGQSVKYTVTATNTGQADFTADHLANVVDDLSGVLDDTAAFDQSKLSSSPTGVTWNAATKKISWSGILAKGGAVAITYEVKYDASTTGDKTLTNIAFQPKDPSNPTTPQCADANGDKRDDTTGELCAKVDIPAANLSRSKSVSVSPTQVGKPKPGSQLTYTLTFDNPGTAAATLNYTDLLADILDDATMTTAPKVNTITGTNAIALGTIGADGKLAVTGTLGPKSKATVTYTVTVKPWASQGNHGANNFLIAPGETPKTCPVTDPNTTCTPLGNPAMEVTKAVVNKTRASAAYAQAGDVLEYTVTATNTGDAPYDAFLPAYVIDELKQILDDADYNNDATATIGSAPGLVGTRLQWSGNLDVGQTVAITYTATVKETPATGADNNAANIAFAATSTSDQSPSACVDPAKSAKTCAATSTPIGTPSLEITKASTATTDTRVGDTVTYTVTAKNTGTADYTTTKRATVLDDLTGVLDDATYNKDAVATIGGTSSGTVQWVDPRVQWQGALGVGETVTITYTVTVKDGGDTTMRNVAFASPDTTTKTPLCDPPNAKGQDPTTGLPCAQVKTLLPRLSIVKSADKSALPADGATINYTVKATNIGKGAYTTAGPATVVDDLSEVIDDGAFVTASLSSNPAGATWDPASKTIKWTGPLAANAFVTIAYQVTYDANKAGGDHHLDNVAFQPKNPANPITPTCADTNQDGKDDTTGEVCATWQIPGAGLITSKDVVVSPAQVGLPKQGSTLTYTLSFENTGEADATVNKVDDLSDILDDATMTTAPKINTIRGTNTLALGTIGADGKMTITGSLAAGAKATVTYTVTLKDYDSQGNHNANNYLTTPGDTIPKCPVTDLNSTCTPLGDPRLVVTKAVENSTSKGAAYAQAGDTLKYTITATNVGDAPFDAMIPAVVIDELKNLMDDADYNSDAASDLGASPGLVGTRLQWSGALAVNQKVTITYTATVRETPAANADKKIDNIVFWADKTTDASPSSCTGTAKSTQQCADTSTPVGTAALSIAKTSTATQDTRPGDTVTYTVTATNNGTADYTAANKALVVDDLTGVADDAAYDKDAVAKIDGATQAAPTWQDPKIIWQGPLAKGKSVVITYSVTVGESGDRLMRNVAFAPPSASTTTPTCDPPVGGVDQETGLPCAEVETPLPKLTIAKSADQVTLPTDGAKVTYTVTATNIGEGPYTTAKPAHVIDDLSAVLDDADLVTTSVSSVPAGATWNPGSQTITWDGALAKGAKVTITYQVAYQANKGGDRVLDNVAYQPKDPTKPSTPKCVDANKDGRDDTTGEVCAKWSVPGAGLTTSKSVVVAPTQSGLTKPGSTLTYTLTFENTGEAAATVNKIDDLSDVLDDATVTTAPKINAITGTNTLTLGTIGADGKLTITGSLPAKSKATVTYTVTVKAWADQGNHAADNFLITPGDTPKDCPSDDPNTTCTQLGNPKLEIGKSVKNSRTGASVAQAGDVLTYTVTAKNVGDAPFDSMIPAVLIDDFAKAADDAVYGNDAKVTPSVGTLAGPTSNRLTWTGSLAVGDTVTLTYTMTVKENLDQGDKKVDNIAFAAAKTTDSTPSACSGTSAQTKQCATTSTSIGTPELSIAKTSSANKDTRPGDKVTYTVTAKNVGDADYTTGEKARVVDDLTGVLDDATFNKDATAKIGSAEAGALTWASPRLLWLGALNQGESVTITYSVTVGEQGDNVMRNVAFAPPADKPDEPTPECDPASSQGKDPATGLPCAETKTPLPELKLTKTADKTELPTNTGDVSYRVTAENIGEGDYTTAAPARVVDDLTAVLDDATLNQASISSTPAGATWDAAKNAITWTGPLAKGAKVTIAYTVSYDAGKGGDKHLKNVVFQSDGKTGEKTPACVDINPVDGRDDATNVVCAKHQLPGAGLEWSKIQTVDPKQTAKVKAGSVVTYTLAFTNTGDTDATVDTYDDLADVLDDAIYNDDAAVTWKKATGDTTSSLTVGAISANKMPITGIIAPKTIGYITFSVTVKPYDQQSSGHSLANVLGDKDECTAEACPPPIDLGDPKLKITKTVVNSREEATVAQGGDTLTYTVTAKNVGDADYDALIPAVLIDDLTEVLDDATYNKDASVDVPGTLSALKDNRLVWTGGLSVGDTATLTYSVTVKENADQIDKRARNIAFSAKTTTDVTIGECPSGDTPCAKTETEIGTPEIALTKSFTNLTGPDTDVRIGDKLQYTVTAKNIGDADYTAAEPAKVGDDLSQMLDDATYSKDAVVRLADGSPAGGQLRYDEPTITWTGRLASGDTLVLTYTVTVIDGKDGDRALRNVAYEGTTVPECDLTDPVGVDPVTGKPCARSEQDVPKLALAKSADPKVLDTNGGVVTYTVTATNIGPGDFTDAAKATVTDNLRDVLDDGELDTGSVSSTPAGARWDAATQTISWSGPLAAGDKAVIIYRVNHNAAKAGADHKLENVAFEGTTIIDGCVDKDGDGRDDTTGVICVPNTVKAPYLVTSKTVDPALADSKLRPGASLTYTLTFTNKGEADAVVSKVDDLTDVLDDADVTTPAASSDASLTVGAVKDGKLPIAGTLTPGQTVTVTYTVTAKAWADQGDHRATNFLIENGQTPPATCETANDNCTDTPLGNPIAAIAKTVVNTSRESGIARVGDVLKYTVTLTNTGDAPFDAKAPARMVDDLAALLDDASYNGDAKVEVTTPDAGKQSVDYATPRLTWEGPLAPGETATMTYTVTIKAAADRGDSIAKNIAFVPETPDSETPKACETGSTTCGETTTDLADPSLALTKTVDNITHPGEATAQSGDTLKYVITVTNDSKADYPPTKPAQIADSLAGVLDDATWNDQVSADIGEVSFTAPTLTWSGPLAVGEKATITYTVTVKAAAERGDASLDNIVVAYDDETLPNTGSCDDADPTCAATRTPAGDPGLKITKWVETAPGTSKWVTGDATATGYKTGDKAQFRILVENTGSVTQTNVLVEDPLVPACSGTVRSLEPGQRATFECEMVVSGDATNTATASSDSVGKVTSSASLKVPVYPIAPLPLTGGDYAKIGAAMAALLAAGGALLILRRRRDNGKAATE